jgi:hypothetical protein
MKEALPTAKAARVTHQLVPVAPRTLRNCRTEFIPFYDLAVNSWSSASMGVVFNHPGGTGDFQPVRRRRQPQPPVTRQGGPTACGRVPQAQAAARSTPLLPVTASRPSGHMMERLVASRPGQTARATLRCRNKVQFRNVLVATVRRLTSSKCSVTTQSFKFPSNFVRKTSLTPANVFLPCRYFSGSCARSFGAFTAPPRR